MGRQKPPSALEIADAVEQALVAAEKAIMEIDARHPVTVGEFLTSRGLRPVEIHAVLVVACHAYERRLRQVRKDRRTKKTGAG